MNINRNVGGRFTSLMKMLILALALILFYRLTAENKQGNGFGTDDVQNEKNKETAYDFAMGTSVSVSVYGTKDTAGINAEIISAIQGLDEGVLSWREANSELGGLNRGYTKGEAYPVSASLYSALSEALGICGDSEGALDITIRPLADTWKIESTDAAEFTVPGEKAIDEALCHVGYERISLVDASEEEGQDIAGYVSIDEAKMILDLGAVGKGYALDVVCDVLEQKNVKGAAVSVGGSVLVYGRKNDGSDWKVGVRNPKGAMDDMIGYLTFPADTVICVSTSGDYEKYHMVDNIRYHHILDRSTGYPADSGLASVTVVCESGLAGDGLSTACFVLGYERSLPLLKKYNAEAVFIDNDNNVTVTEGLADCFKYN